MKRQPRAAIPDYEDDETYDVFEPSIDHIDAEGLFIPTTPSARRPVSRRPRRPIEDEDVRFGDDALTRDVGDDAPGSSVVDCVKPQQQLKTLRLPRNPLPDLDEQAFARRSRPSTPTEHADLEVVPSGLWDKLYCNGRPRNGHWIPDWVVKAVGSEARARILAEILWWFALAFSDQRKLEAQPKSKALRRARARVYDPDGYQWVALSVRNMAARTMVKSATTADAIHWLVTKGLIAARVRNRTCVLRPLGPALAQAFYTVTNDQMAFTEFLNPATRISSGNWVGSETQRKAMNVSCGITVHNELVRLLNYDLFHARLLSQILFYFADAKKGCRAKVVIDGNLYWAASPRSLSQKLGVSPSKVLRGIEQLVSKGFLIKRIALWKGARAIEPHFTTHLRPCVRQINSQLTQLDVINPVLSTEENDHHETPQT